MPFTQAFGLEDVLQDGFSENALHLALPLEGLGQVFGRGPYGFGLLPKVPDRFRKLFLDGRALLELGFLLGVKGFLHRTDVPVQVSGYDFHGFGRLLFEGLLALLHQFLILQRKGGSGCLDSLFLTFLHLPQAVFVNCLLLLAELFFPLTELLGQTGIGIPPYQFVVGEEPGHETDDQKHSGHDGDDGGSINHILSISPL